MDVVLHARDAADHDPIVELATAADPDQRRDPATSAHPHVVPDLHHVVNLGAGADPGHAGRRAVDAGIGADLDIILDHHTADLRQLARHPGLQDVAEAVRADDGPAVDPHSPAESHALVNGDVRKEDRIIPDAHLVAQADKGM